MPTNLLYTCFFRYGSLIIDAAAVVPEKIKERSGANLTMSLRELANTKLTIGSYTGIPILRVNNTTGLL